MSQKPERRERALTSKKDKKLPAMQFYPGDWRKDMGVQALAFHDRGVWFEMLMLMHGSERRGVLVLNGQTMSEEMIARSIGLDIQAFHNSLAALLDTGVASREEGTDAVMCRRMVNDEYLRKVRVAAGSQGGNPALLNQTRTNPHKQDPTPSSSLSVSSSASATRTKTLARIVPPEELAGTLPLVDGTDYFIAKARVAEWSLAYPAVDVIAELRRFKCWLDANPTKKKTRSGIARSIVRWLSKAQNQSGFIGLSNGNKSQHRTDGNFGAARRVAERLHSENALDACGSSSGIGE